MYTNHRYTDAASLDRADRSENDGYALYDAVDVGVCVARATVTTDPVTGAPDTAIGLPVTCPCPARCPFKAARTL